MKPPFEPGQQVWVPWFNSWYAGRVMEVLRTRVRVAFHDARDRRRLGVFPTKKISVTNPADTAPTGPAGECDHRTIMVTLASYHCGNCGVRMTRKIVRGDYLYKPENSR